jgi:hypothetical protein
MVIRHERKNFSDLFPLDFGNSRLFHIPLLSFFPNPICNLAANKSGGREVVSSSMEIPSKINRLLVILIKGEGDQGYEIGFREG